jgi:DNA polymerase I-like protein with 3'-5' exonuclease and polymerase domains
LILSLDVETSTIEKGHVHHPDNFLVSCSIAYSNSVIFKYYKDPDFLSYIQSRLDNASEIVGFNIKFDIQWLIRNGIKIPKQCRIYDVSLAEQILTAQQSPMVSLNAVCEEYGIPLKIDAVKGYWEQGISTEDIPVQILEEYNNDDATKNLRLRGMQMELLTVAQLRLVYEQGEDLLVLARAELNGVKFDVARARESYSNYQKELAGIEALLNEYIPADIPGGFNWDSGDQLSALLYGGTITYDKITPEERVYGKTAANPGKPYTYNRHTPWPIVFPRRFNPDPRTEVKKTKDDPTATTRFYQVDDISLAKLTTRDRGSRKLLDLLGNKARFTKIIESFEGIFKRQQQYKWGEYIHGQFNQNVARTGRLSSSNPNTQNTAEDVDYCLVSRYD